MKKDDVTALVPIDDRFVSKIPAEKLLNLISIIQSLVTANYTMDKIATYLGMSVEQVRILQNQPEYLDCIHATVKDDAALFRAALTPSIPKVAAVLKEKAEGGNLGAMRLFIKAIGAEKTQEKGPTDQIDKWIDFLKSLGISPKDIEASEKIKEIEGDVVDVEWQDELLKSTIPELENPLYEGVEKEKVDDDIPELDDMDEE